MQLGPRRRNGRRACRGKTGLACVLLTLTEWRLRHSVPPGARALQKQLVQPDRQGADPDAGGVVHRVRDRGRGDHDADLADPLGAGRSELGFVLIDPPGVYVAAVAVGPAWVRGRG